MRPAVLAIALMTTLAVGAPALASGDASFMRKAIEGDNSEMNLGQMATQRGASDGVRSFGQMLNQDHSASRQQAVPIAQALGVAPTDSMTPEARQEARKLRGLSGRAFDHEFVRYMVKDHRKDIGDFERQTRIGDARTREFAQQTLPTLHKHLDTALSLEHGH